jgi:hypothetical protein
MPHEAPSFAGGFSQSMVSQSATSMVQGLPSSHMGPFVGTQRGGMPATQRSPVVHALPSSHVPVLSSCTQPVIGLQLSSVHWLPSSQSRAGPPQVPLAQVSGPVHWLPSLHVPVRGVAVHPVCGLQPSVVHSLPSLQLLVVPAQFEPEHVSLVVHSLSSSQGPVMFVCWHVPFAQVSVVQALLSLQFSHAPPFEPQFATAST